MKKKSTLILCTAALIGTISVSAVLAAGIDSVSDVLVLHETQTEVSETTARTVAPDPVHVTLIKNGAATEYTYFPVTCAEFLRFAGIALTDIERVSIPADTVLTDGMLVSVTTDETVERIADVTTPEEYDYIDVDTIPMGSTQIITRGTPGRKLVTYLDRYVGGALVSSEVVSEQILEQGTRGSAYRGVGGYVTSKAGVTYHYSYDKVMEATAYTYIPGLTTMTCATGARLAKGCVAVDPRVIPMKTKMFITSDNFEYGYGSAEDTGGAIKGNIVDLAFMSYNECVQFGRRMMRVYILD